MTRARLLRTVQDVAAVGTAFFLLLLLAFPTVWVFTTSLKPEKELFTRSLRLLGTRLSLEHYVQLAGSDFPRFLINSVFVCVTATVIALALSVLAAYAFSRFTFAGKDSLLITIAFSQMFPWVILITPVYFLFWRLRLVNTYTGLIVAYIAITIPFSIYMLVGYLQSIPRELDDAASIDGCTTLGVITRVILPVAAPGLVATATYAFAQTWNEFLFALTFMTRTELKTVPVGLANFFGQYTAEWGLVMAASALATIPTLLFFLLLQRHLTAGLTAGAMKQ